MEIPDKIKLGGHIVKIEKVSKKDIDSGGEYNLYYDLIRVRTDDTPESSIAECFLHEIIEGIKYKYEIALDHANLTVLSEVLFQVIRENKLNFFD